MQGRFYQDVFEPAGLALVVPDESEQAYIHDKYMNELVKGVLLPETRERLLAIVEQMKARDGIDAVILGGTELPLMLRDDVASGIPLLDTTVIHAKAIVARALARTDGADRDHLQLRHRARRLRSPASTSRWRCASRGIRRSPRSIW